MNLSRLKEIKFGFLRSKVARRIFFLFIICALLPLSLIFFFSFNQLTKYLYNHTDKILHQANKITSMAIFRRFSIVETDIKTIISNLQKSNTDSLELATDDFHEQLKDRFKGFALMTGSGQVISSLGAIQSLSKLNKDEQQHIGAGKTLIIVRTSTDKFASILIGRVLDPAQPSHRLLFGEINPDYLWVTEDLLSPKTELFVLDQTYNVLFSSVLGHFPLQELKNAMQVNSKSMSFTWTHEGDTYLANYRTLFMHPQFFLNLIFVYSQSKADILKPVDTFKKFFQLVIVLSFLIVLFLSHSQIRRSLVPIELLRAATQRIAAKDFESRVSIESNDEFEELGESFNNMSTTLMENQKQLEYQAFYDTLTNLPNRILFTKHLELIVNRRKRHKGYQFAVLFIDLDRFKIINDSLGHIVGDKLLIAVARKLKDCIRPNDVVSRFGGDEFSILLDDINTLNDATHTAERIQKELTSPLNLDGHTVFITTSIGIALSTTGYDQAEDVLRDADSAMYRAKDLGRARYAIFDTDMHTSAMKLLQLEADLRQACKRKEFLIYYQPIVSLTNGRITGVEALIRWQHPQHGLVLPMKFIPLAEETGLILTIGEWILETACAQNKAWQNAGYPHMRMDINFSARQFQHQDIPKLIKRVLNKTGLAAQYLDVEITESIAMETNSINILNELSAIGVLTSIDDFGTGYSSLGSLKLFSINTMKIDKSFVKDITKDSNAEAIIKGIIAMSHSLNIKVLSEGVETEEQLAFLNLNQCDEIQGYICSPPVPANEFEKLLKEGLRLEPRIKQISTDT